MAEGSFEFSVTVDATQIVNELVDGVADWVEERNNLLFIIQNPSDFSWNLNWSFVHGGLENFAYHTVPPNKTLAVPFKAVGEGCNATLYFTAEGSTEQWAVMGATPVNRDNYVKTGWWSFLKAQGDVQNQFDNEVAKHYAENRIQTVTSLEEGLPYESSWIYKVWITGTSEPALCYVNITDPTYFPDAAKLALPSG